MNQKVNPSLKAALDATPVDQIWVTIVTWFKAQPQFASPAAQAIISVIGSLGDALLQHLGI